MYSVVDLQLEELLTPETSLAVTAVGSWSGSTAAGYGAVSVLDSKVVDEIPGRCSQRTLSSCSGHPLASIVSSSV